MIPCSNISQAVQLPITFDTNLLKEDLHSLEQQKLDWVDHFVTQNYEGSWSVIPLRAAEEATHPVMMIYSDPAATNYTDTFFLEHCKYFKEVLSSFKTELLAARLMKLSSNSEIKEHRDHDLEFEQGTVRVHIPIITNDKVEFYLNNVRVVMEEGECWYLRLSDPHKVINKGPDRIHLVIDMKVNRWLEGMFGV